MPVESTIEKARASLDAGDCDRAKEILRSSLGNYGFSPKLYRAYADILLSAGDDVQAGRFLFFSVDSVDESYREPVEAFLASCSEGGYSGIIRALPPHGANKLSELPDYSRAKLTELGAPEDFSKINSGSEGWWIFAGCLATATVVTAFACIGLWTVIRWITN